MYNRVDLHKKLCDILGSNNVFYQPPENIRLTYPCIIYELGGIDTLYADGIPYLHTLTYDVLYIHRDPDESSVLSKLLELSGVHYSRRYKSDNLYHDSLSIKKFWEVKPND